MFNRPMKDSMVNPLPIAPRRDTAAWRLQVWISFGVAASLCAIGLAWLPGAASRCGRLRDAHEADLFEARMAGRRDAAAK